MTRNPFTDKDAGLPPGEWIERGGVRRFRPAPNLERAQLHQERQILTIILATKGRAIERERLFQAGIKYGKRRKNADKTTQN